MSQPKVWLIGGGSSGLGVAIALAALHSCHKVILGTRNPEQAAKDYPKVAELGGRWIELDVSLPSAQTIAERAIQEEGRCDVVINCAGYLALGTVEDVR